MNPFEQLLKELGIILNLSLRPDPHQACLLQFENNITVQIEYDIDANRILFGSQLAKLNAGPYREKILKEAMKSNGTIDYGKGILAHSEKNDTLIMFCYISTFQLTGSILAQHLEHFLQQIRLWIDALQHGEIPRLEEQPQSSGALGLK